MAWARADGGLIVGVLAVSGSSRDPAIASAAGRPAWFGEGLLVRMLLGMNLVVEEISRQLLTVIYLQLREKHSEVYNTNEFKGYSKKVINH